MTIRSLLKRIGLRFNKPLSISPREKVYLDFAEYTMIPQDEYLRNLILAEKIMDTQGSVIECGVWKGGMIAGMASILGNDRDYYLFDSFEGLPEVQEIDGSSAARWQSNKTSHDYFDNCTAEINFATQAMSKALGNNEKVHLIKGWFNETMNEKNFDGEIALLRLDGDWYESTMTCLKFLFPKVVPGGMIIIDDYHIWEGCTKAVHDYLSKNDRPERICQFENKTAYIIKL